MSKKNFPEFRQLLKTAMIGYERTQADFAKDATIAPETLNRMLNQDTIAKPTKNTLRKIASVAKNGVTYDMLLEACEYEPETNNHKTLKEKTQSFIEFGDYFAKHRSEYSMSPFASIDDFIKSAIMLCTSSDIVYDICDGLTIRKESERYGDHAAIVTLSTKLDNTVSATTDVLVLYYTTVTGKCIISFATNDVHDTVKYGSDTAKKILNLRERPDKKADNDSNILYIKLTNRKKYEPLSSTELLFNSIFGKTMDGKSSTEKTVDVYGIGFYIPKTIPEFVIKNFLKKHKDSFCWSEKEKHMYEKYIINNVSRTSVFGDYPADTTTGAGGNCWLAAIINVIYRETKLNVQGWSNIILEEDEQPRNAIVFASGMPWDFTEDEKYYSYTGLVSVLDRYARELHTRVNVCAFTATFYAHQ